MADASEDVAELLQSAKTAIAMGRLEDARGFCRRVLAGEPGNPAALCNLAGVLLAEGRLEEAAAACRSAIATLPHFAEPYANLANARLAQGRTAEAIAANRRTIRLRPGLRHGLSNHLFALNYDDGLPAAAVLDEHRALGALLAVPAAARPPRVAKQRIRIGYVSADFCAHPVGFFVAPLLSGHDRTRFEILLYPDIPAPDALTGWLRAHADGWRPITGLGAEAAARLVRENAVDVLVDLGGHTSRNRLDLFALRPAPVQVTWLGYPNTTGLPAMDFRISDAVADPPGPGDRLNTEAVVRLPNGFLCYRAPLTPPPVGPPPCTTKGVVTFGSFNNIAKVSRATVRLWSRALKSCGNARLLLKGKSFADADTVRRYRAAFADEGVDPARVELRSWADDLQAHLAAYADLDVALDTHPYNGTTTTFEALLMGVPVVTLAGDRHASRVGASILHHLGLGALIADDEEGFAAIAAGLAADPHRLTTLRPELRARLVTSPMCNGPLFARTMEIAYRRMLEQLAPGA